MKTSLQTKIIVALWNQGFTDEASTFLQHVKQTCNKPDEITTPDAIACKHGLPAGECFTCNPSKLPNDLDPDRWWDWEGGENPVPGKMVEMEFRDGGKHKDKSDNWPWDHVQSCSDIVRYRVIDDD